MALTDGPSGLKGVPGHMNPATVGQVGVEIQELRTQRHHGCRLHFVHERLEDHRYSNTKVRGGMDRCHDTVAEEHAAVVGWVGHPPGPPRKRPTSVARCKPPSPTNQTSGRSPVLSGSNLALDDRTETTVPTPQRVASRRSRTGREYLSDFGSNCRSRLAAELSLDLSNNSRGI